jgi:hypothetical protein
MIFQYITKKHPRPQSHEERAREKRRRQAEREQEKGGRQAERERQAVHAEEGRGRPVCSRTP